MVKKIIIVLVTVDLVLLAIGAYIGGNWMVNSQIAFITSALVMGASMLSYARMVKSRLEAGEIPGDDRDVIEQLDDPHDLYSENISQNTAKETADVPTLKEAIKEEKNRMKSQRRSPLEALRDSRASMSVYRLGAYALLVFGFFYLNSNHLLQPLPYLIGMGIPVAVVVTTLMSNKDNA